MKSEKNGHRKKALFNWVAYMRGFFNDFRWIYCRPRMKKWSFGVAVKTI